LDQEAMHMQSPILSLIFDIGGTSIRTGLYDHEWRCLERYRKTNAPNFLNATAPAGENILDRLLALLKEEAAALTHDAFVARVCVALPSPIAPDGTSWRLPTLLGVEDPRGVRLLERLEELWPDAQVVVINDVTAAGYFHVANGSRDFAVVSVGSGVGLKVFLDGEPRTGPHGRGGEIGHVRVEPRAIGNIACDCGERGHLGSFASGRGALRLARHAAATDPDGFAASLAGRLVRERKGSLDNDILVAAFRDNDAWITQVVTASASYLAQAIAFLHQSIGLEDIVLTGGFAHACGEKYRQLVVRLARPFCWDTGQDWNAIIRMGSDPDTEALEGAGYFMASRDRRERHG
jgi:glucokinase